MAELLDAEEEGGARRRSAELRSAVDGSIDGIYVAFESFPGVELALERLDPRVGKVHPELMSVQVAIVDGEPIERATVFIPDGKLGYFLRKLEQYVDTAYGDSPRHRQLVDRIRRVGLASLSELWTDSAATFPTSGERVWWELWLRRRDGREVERLKVFAAQADGVDVADQTLGFADRTVALVQATAEELAGALDVLDDLAEVRRPREPFELLAGEPAPEQAEWVDQLASRVSPAPPDAPAACIVDTGVHQPHPLLEKSLDPNDCHTVDPNWDTGDDHGHGTEMAGLALFGDVGSAIGSGDAVALRHRLESVKLLPPPPLANPRKLWGALTATAASLVEIQQRERRRVFSMAISAAPEVDDNVVNGSLAVGQPTSWSSAVDAISAGLGIDVTDDGLVFLDESEEPAQRLFLIATGNVLDIEDDHLSRSDLEAVEDPGQAWNALTIGAYTAKVDLTSAPSDYDGWTVVAASGELSPFSRTSVPFNSNWPVKPDVVFEGGNVARSPDGTAYDTPDTLQILTTKAPLRDRRTLTVTRETSAACAQAAHLAGRVLSDYPGLWPETVRALIVHSAEWTPAMNAHFGHNRTKAARLALQRRYGMGVPDAARAFRSAADALTLIVQDVIHPFDGQGRMREMHLHDLPWPTEVLEQLGSIAVRLRVTLSYFIEPNPGRRGWKQRYRYASHGLRFDIRRATESTDDFRKRINQYALTEEERRPWSEGDGSEWFFGPTQRNRGSLHTDIWTGTAVDLANRGAIAIYPVTGWWKERKERDHSARGARYALVVSIETPDQDVDIWTPAAQEIGIPVEIEV